MADGSGDRLAALLERPAAGEVRAGAPLVALIHGLGGDENSVYLQSTSAHLLQRGYPVLRLNLRGAGPSRPWCREQYHAGRSEDLRDALAAVSSLLPPAGLVLVGFSLGGNMLLKFLAEHGSTTHGLRGAVSVSAPIDLSRAAHRILETRNRFYHRHLLGGMKQEALADQTISKEERRIVEEVTSIVDFDDRIVARRNGFAGAEDYYAKTHARQFLSAIRVETLVIHALDDPWIPAAAYTSFDWSSNPHLTPLLPSGGGHLGFHAQGSRIPWHDRCLEDFLASLEGDARELPSQVPAAIGGTR
jgi:predicted alpha/beta-fold hydrolase